MRFYIGEHAGDSWQAGSAAIAQVKHEARVAQCVPPEAGWRNPGGAQMGLDAKQEHYTFLDSMITSSFRQKSYLSRTNVPVTFLS